jgi:UDP-glucose 6-dehydrogenase
LCKYYNNIYNATLITFANSFYEVCKKLNVNYSEVKDAVVNINHITDLYLDCNENFRGFGGVCLPKDTKAIDSICRRMAIDVDFFQMIIDENNKYKVTVFDGMRK